MKNELKKLMLKFAPAWLFSSATSSLKLTRIVEKFDVVEKAALPVRIRI